MYSIDGYGRMVADRVRMDAYLTAMARVIRPGSVVVDLGAGPGVMALHACRLGAARVYAVEPDDSISIAVELAAANGMAERIALAQQFAERVDLPERVDVIVSDLRGVMPLHRAHPAVIIDVRQRWLKPDGTLIPMRDTVQACLVRPGPYYDRVVDPWQPQHGIDLTPVRKWALATPKKVRFVPEDMATAPRVWTVLDYRTVTSTDVTSQVSWAIEEPATVCGVAMWTEAELLEGVGFSNAPGPRAAIHGQYLMPWSEPVALARGDQVRVTLSANSRRFGYLWAWTTEIVGADGTTRNKFTQGGPSAIPPSLSNLPRKSPQFG